MQPWANLEEGRYLLRTHWCEDAQSALRIFENMQAVAWKDFTPISGGDDPGQNFYIQCCYWRAAALTRLGRWGLAEQQAYNLIELASKYDMAHYAYGRYFLGAGSHDDAIVCFEDALRINPLNERGLRDMVRATRLSGRGNAVRLAETSQQVLPDSFQLQAELALSLAVSPDAANRERATSAAAEAFERSGGTPESHTLLARILAAQGRYDEATTRCDKALALDGQYYHALLLKTWLADPDQVWDHNDFPLPTGPEFLNCYPKPLAAHPLDPSATLEEAQKLGDEQRYAESLALYDSVLERHPDSLQAQAGKIRCLRLMCAFGEATSLALAQIGRFPESWPLYVELGCVYYDQGKFEDGLRQFDAARRLNPLEIDICLARSLSLCALRRYGEAKRSVQSFLADHPDDFRLLEEDAWISYYQAALGAAAQAFDRLLHRAATGEERARIHYGLGYVTFARGDYTDAQDYFEKAFEEHNITTYRIAYAWSLTRSADRSALQEAMRICEEIIATEDNEPEACRCLGVAYFRLDELDDSKEYLERAVAKSATQSAHTDLGALYAARGDDVKAEAQLHEAIEADPNYGPAHIELGALLLRTGENGVREAAREFRKAQGLDRSSVPAAIGLSECYHLEGDDDRAEEELRSAIRRTEGGDKWRLYVTLSRLLIRKGKRDQDLNLLSEAYDAAYKAIGPARANRAEPLYLAGLAHRLMGDYAESQHQRLRYHRSAIGHLRDCLAVDGDHRQANRERLALEGDIAESRQPLSGRRLWIAIALILLGIAIADFFKLMQIPAELLIIDFAAALLMLGIGLFRGEFKRIRGPAGIEIEFNPRDPVVAVGPVGRLAVDVDRIDLPPHIPSGQPRRGPVVSRDRTEQ
jgi:tetratricopeptide (TPR) repeat protein